MPLSRATRGLWPEFDRDDQVQGADLRSKPASPDFVSESAAAIVDDEGEAVVVRISDPAPLPSAIRGPFPESDRGDNGQGADMRSRPASPDFFLKSAAVCPASAVVVAFATGAAAASPGVLGNSIHHCREVFCDDDVGKHGAGNNFNTCSGLVRPPGVSSTSLPRPSLPPTRGLRRVALALPALGAAGGSLGCVPPFFWGAQFERPVSRGLPGEQNRSPRRVRVGLMYSYHSHFLDLGLGLVMSHFCDVLVPGAAGSFSDEVLG